MIRTKRHRHINKINSLHLIAMLFTCVGLMSVMSRDALAETYRECIQEPIFKGRVCTVQTNRDAQTGVVLIHGLGGSAEDWVKTIPVLSKNFHVLAFDLPGFGDSDKGSKSYSPTHYAQLTQYLISHYFKNKSYDVVGHSMGGAISLRYASQRPAGLNRLVLIDAAGILHPQVMAKFQAGSMIVSKSGVQQTRGFIERFSGKLLEQADRLPISVFEIANTALGRDKILQGGPEKIAALELAGEDFSLAMTSVATPTLILWGDSDPIAPLRTGQVLAANMQQAELKIINGSGHEPMKDQPEQLNELINDYLLLPDNNLAAYFKQQPVLPPFTTSRKGTCTELSDKIFEGDYRSIELHDCTSIIIRNARVGKLTAVNSRLTISNTSIIGKDIGLVAENSYVTITNGKISGDIAIKASNSRFDIAGTYLNGTVASISGMNSKFTFSVSHVNSPLTFGSMHDYKNLVDGEL